MKLTTLSVFVNQILQEQSQNETQYITSSDNPMPLAMYGFNENEQLRKILAYQKFLNQTVIPQMFEGDEALFKNWSIKQNTTPEHNHNVLFFKGEPKFNLSFFLVGQNENGPFPMTLSQIAQNKAMSYEFFELTPYALKQIFRTV